MELVQPETHRALAYAIAIAHEGYRVTTDELNDYTASPDRRGPARELVGWLRAHATITASFSNAIFGEVSDPGETVVEHLVRLRWARLDASRRVEITDLGRALYSALERQQTKADDEQVTTVVLNADDPFALPRLLERYESAGPALLVDPYFRARDLPAVLACTNITRVLTSDNIKEKQLNMLGFALTQFEADRPFEVRVAQTPPHDRHLVPDTGPIHFVGTSIGGVGKKPTVAGQLTDGAESIRSYVEDLWRESGPVPAPQTVAESDSSARLRLGTRDSPN